MLKVDLQAIEADITEDAPKSKMVVPMPEPVVVPPRMVQDFGSDYRTWIYRMEDGGAYGAVIRWDLPGGKKEVRPIIWNGKGFVAGGFENNRPLYNSDAVAAHPLAPVLIVEGEKTADAAAAFVPDGWVVVTWQGGANAVAKSRWKLLAGRRCVIWPDNDAAGIAAASKIQEILSKCKAACAIVALSPAFSDGWDLADPLPEKYSPEQITRLIEKGFRDSAVATFQEEAIPVFAGATEPDSGDLDIDPDQHYRALGYNHGTYYLLTYRWEQVAEYTAANLMGQVALMEMHPDRNMWAEKQHNLQGKVDWVMAGSAVMEECRRAGVYDLKRMRGRGVWIDKDKNKAERVVVHTGGALYVGRKGEPLRKVPFVNLKSKWIYERRDELIVDIEDYNTPLSDDEGRTIKEMCQHVRWGSKIYGDLFAGWMATAVICGALDWRTHVWITGNQGSGKSTVVNSIIGAVIGDQGIYPQGNTTEAGIRTKLASDATPVIFDESETEKNAEERRQAVLSLMRQASSNSRGTIMKGSANHEAHEFAVRSSFLLASIGVGLKQAADLSRTAVLTIRPLDSYPAAERKRLDDQWNRLQDIIASLPTDIPQKLLIRQSQNIFTLKHNIGVFKQVITEMFDSPRIGDMLGTLLAGCYSLYSTNEISADACRRYLDQYDMEEFMTSKGEREDSSILHHICSAMVRVETLHGVQDRTIGELLDIVFNRREDQSVRYSIAEDVLQRYGLRVQWDENRTRTGVLVSTRADNLNRIMQTSTFFEGWEKVIMRNPYAQKVDRKLRFGGVAARPILIPIQEWPINE